MNISIYNIIYQQNYRDDMKLKDITTSMPLPNQKQALTAAKKKPQNGAPETGAQFKKFLDKEKSK